MRLGEALIDRRLIARQELEAALAEQAITGERLGAVLVRSGFLKHAQLVSVLAEIAPESLMRENAAEVRPDYAELHRVRTMIAAVTPGELFAATLRSEREARRVLERHYPDRAIRFVPLSADRYVAFMQRLRLAEGAVEFEADGNGDRILENILSKAVEAGASDVHVHPGERAYMVRVRLDGQMVRVRTGSREEHTKLLSCIKDRAGMDIAETRRPQDGGWSEERGGRSLSYRVNTVPTVGGEKATIRVLDSDRASPTLADLGITRLDEWLRGMVWDNGLVLIAGPTGSGKTTTLNATLRSPEAVDRFGRQVYSVEEPVEYRVPFVDQVAVNPAVGLDFPSSIKAFMRGDPDIIMLGEIRDHETATNAVRAAETGHLVLATVHAGSILQVVNRLRNIGVEPHNLRHLLRTVMVQRLVRKVCKACGGEGCVACLGTGYRGRTVVSEVQSFSTQREVDRLLAGESWWPTIAEDAKAKLASGETTPEEIERLLVASSADE
ncbi:GspE/PulE family protein [Azospirillum sp. TSO5]|uniref:GspE/PulE family protein n=1 Tax=Azospirillum sp. TSO5 TaxID=716760 RepID=UPI000D607421|nr:GspE/PulE family protein [Azospirillum sp. TSO5]PWC92964.1 hypothetical protein TSO5_16180 [Azospirillum sp. TSO5]